jgi:hypothetical protein
MRMAATGDTGATRKRNFSMQVYWEQSTENHEPLPKFVGCVNHLEARSLLTEGRAGSWDIFCSRPYVTYNMTHIP